MSNIEELKPCPFCGGKAKEVIPTQVICSNANCIISTIVMHDSIWNTRTTNGYTKEQVDELARGKEIEIRSIVLSLIALKASKNWKQLDNLIEQLKRLLKTNNHRNMRGIIEAKSTNQRSRMKR